MVKIKIMKINSSEESQPRPLDKTFLPACVGSCNCQFQRFLDHLSRVKECSDLAPTNNFWSQQIDYTPEPRCLLVNLLPIVILLLLQQNLESLVVWLQRLVHSTAPTHLIKTYIPSICLPELEATTNSTTNKLLLLTKKSRTLNHSPDILSKKKYRKKKLKQQKTTNNQQSTTSSPNNFIAFSNAHDPPPSSAVNGIFLAPTGGSTGKNVSITASPALYRSHRQLKTIGAIFSLSHFSLLQSSFITNLVPWLLIVYCFYKTLKTTLLCSSYSQPRTMATKDRFKNNAKIANKRSIVKGPLSITSDAAMTSLFASAPPPPPSPTLLTASSDPLLPNLFLDHLDTILHHLSRPAGNEQEYAKSILILNHAVLPDNQTRPLLEKNVTTLHQMGFNIDITPFTTPAGSHVIAMLAGLKEDNCQIKGDLLSTQKHLGIVLNLMEPQWTGDQNVTEPVLPQHVSLRIHAGTSDGGVRYLKTHSQIDVVPLYSIRSSDMTMKEFTSDNLSVTRWIPIMNAVIVRPELSDAMDTYIRLIRYLIHSKLDATDSASLQPRLIIAPCHHVYAGTPDQKTRCEKHKARGLCLMLQNDPSSMLHHTIKTKIFQALLGDSHATSRSGTMNGLPVLFVRPLDGRPSKEVPAKLVPLSFFQLHQHWIVMHHLPVEYTPHHLFALLTWAMEVQGIQHVFQRLDSFSDASTPVELRTQPTFVVCLDSLTNLDRLLASIAQCRQAMVNEQNSLPVMQEFFKHNVPTAGPPWCADGMSWTSPNMDPTSSFPKLKQPREDVTPYASKDVSRFTLDTIKRTRQPSPSAPTEMIHTPQPIASVSDALDRITAHLHMATNRQRDQLLAAFLDRLALATDGDCTIPLLEYIQQTQAANPSHEMLRLIHQWSQAFTHGRMDFYQEDDPEVSQMEDTA